MKRLITFREWDYIESQIMIEKNISDVIKRRKHFEGMGYELVSIVRIY